MAPPFILSSGINSGVKNLWYPFFGVMNLNEGLHYCKIKEYPVGAVYDLYRSLTYQLKTRYTSIIHYLSKLVPIIGPIDMKRISSIYIDNRMNLRPLEKHTKYRLVFKGCINYNLFNSLLINSEYRLCDTILDNKEYIRKNLKDEISKLLEEFERELDPQFSYTELCRLIRDYNYAESAEFVQQFKQELINLNIDVGLIQTTIDPNILFDRIIQTMSI